MPGKLDFKVTVYQTNADILPELANRAKDLSSVFDDIINTWADLNKQKFLAAKGGEESGAQIDPGGTVFWKPLSPQYLADKRRKYPTDTLMVRTGSLMAAMTNPEGFFRAVTPEQAIFGSPNDAEDAMKVQYNWETRQIIFLADYDQNMIREKISKWFSPPPKQTVSQQAATLDAEFQGAVS